MTLESEIIDSLRLTRAASKRLALAPTARKNRALESLTSMLRGSTDEIIAANRSDLQRARDMSRNDAFIERLTLNPVRIEAMARSVTEVAALPDPVSEVIESWQRPNGLKISKVRVPLGVIAIIYESRPNVTIDAAVLAIKSGNAVVLRGGREAIETNSRLAVLIRRALEAAELPVDSVMFIDRIERDVIGVLKNRPDLIDLIIPRGGSALKEALADATVPLLPHFDGICHTYVDQAADLAMATAICVNAKCSRPSVCNAMETMLVHAAVAQRFLPMVAEAMTAAGVELRGCERTRMILPDVRPAAAADWDTEYLDLILAVKVVDSLEEAVEFISSHGSGLADAIVTEDPDAAARFEREVDSATVYINASTRFTDGFEFGFGAETGISTNRLHARGPMGLRELTTYKYVIHGSGQVRN
jgi:glutamate-5-semialdehyde dehydrogenase